MKPLRLFFLFAALTACSGPLHQLEKATQTPKNTFADDLATEYRDYALSEKELMHKDASTYFAQKGLILTQGKDAPPEQASNWKIKEKNRKILDQAREQLMRVRTHFAQKADSDSVARAQILYDCWVVQMADNDAHDDTAPCHDEFATTLAEIEKIVFPPKPKPVTSLPAHVTILFGLNADTLDHNAQFAIGQILKATQNRTHYTIYLAGHTDRTGSAQYNRELSQKRAQTVMNILVKDNIPANRIFMKAEGENSLLIPTLDGIASTRNRRVEIDIKEKKE